MHAALAQDLTVHREAQRAPAASPRVPPSAAPRSPEYAAYGTKSAVNWPAIATIFALHGALLAALVRLDVIEVGHKTPPPLVVNLISVPPPPLPVAEPEPEIAPIKPVQPVIVAPPPLVRTLSAPPPPVQVVEAAPPPQAAIVAPPAPRPAVPAAPVPVDLASKFLSGKPPRVPAESRRAKEEGTVVLKVLLDVDGRVSDIAIARSSGFERLDKAALDAVRRWRWSPTMQAGQAVQVRGLVEIPFVRQA